jgi:hypothetical protein
MDQLRYDERCADCPGAVAFEPVPVLGPFIGVVGSVLCGLAGALLLLAPFAFDYRQGAHSIPRSSVVDLVTGGGVLLVSLLTAMLFGGALRKRLRVPEPVAAYVAELESAEDPAAASEPARPASEPEPQPAAPAAAAPLGDPGSALRDLLTPLVAALAADLRARENDGAESEGR